MPAFLCVVNVGVYHHVKDVVEISELLQTLVEVENSMWLS